MYVYMVYMIIIMARARACAWTASQNNSTKPITLVCNQKHNYPRVCRATMRLCRSYRRIRQFI